MSATTNGARALRELACVVRSKNAKPYRITLDVFFDDRRVFEYVKATGALNEDAVAALYGFDRKELRSSFVSDEAMAFKFTFRRPVTQGAVGDSDVYGAQQHVPLLDLEIPWAPELPRRDEPDPTEGEEMNEQFFARIDRDDQGLPRELLGYGEHPPRVQWEGDAKVAIQIVVNYEEGSEKSFPMGDGENDAFHEIPFKLDGIRDMAVESVYEYGSRVGIWRLFRVFGSAGIPVTIFGTAVALERNPAVAQKIVERADEVAAHGFRWTNGFEMTREEEREAIRLTVESITKSIGTRPLGWYSREMSVNTRELVVEEGGFLYDSECYSDDLPYWTKVNGKDHLVVPYTLVVNDIRYVLPQGFSSPEDFFLFAKATLDRLRDDGDDLPRMMSIGLHPRFSGNPARADALARFIEYAQGTDDVWFTRRIDIANTFREQIPAGSEAAAAAVT